MKFLKARKVVFDMNFPQLKNDEKKILKDVLSRYTDEPIVFERGEHGKPYLKSVGADRCVCPFPHFNVSHSGDLLVVAVSKNLEVGVDVEKIRELKDRDKLIARYFSPNEQKIFRDLPESEKTKSFFFAWTQKEAYLKFLGKGISVDLKKIEVQMDPKEKPGLLKKSDSAFFHPFELEKDYLGCVVTEKPAKIVF